MRATRPVRLGLLTVVAGAGALTSLVALISLTNGGAIPIGGFEVAPVAAGYDRRAIAEAAAGRPEPLRDAARRSRAAIRQFPYDTGAWLRLAYLQQVGESGLTPAGVAALQQSYDLVAVDPDFGVWRVAFALEHSQALSKPLRALVRQEATALWTNGKSRDELRKLQTQLHNPAGRLSLALWINLMPRQDAK